MKIIFKTIFGSHLYGTQTENSDTDYKGIFLETLDHIILRKDVSVIHETTKEGKGAILNKRNKPEDIETELKELRRFLHDAMTGQTYALDMLFAPKEYWQEWTSFWDFIVTFREKLLSKKVEPYIGYCRQQAGKYGLKGSRLGELLRVINYLKAFKPKTPLYAIMEGLELSEFVKRYETINERPYGLPPIKEEFIEVLGKKFQLTRFIDDVMESLEKMNQMYGQRAILAMKNEGVDWKAVSHAFRCCYQLIELAENQEIIFPLKEREFLKEVKNGKIPYNELQDQLQELMEKAIKKVDQSKLPSKPNLQFWEDFIVDTYRNS